MPLYASPWAGYDPFGKLMLESTPESAYTTWMQALGAPLGSKKFNYGQSLYGDYQKDYFATAAKPANQGLKWLDYLDKLGNEGGNPMDVFSNLGVRAQGIPGAPRGAWRGF